MTSNTSLYSFSATGNATIPSNNNTSLYNPGSGNVIPVNGNVNANNVNVSNNVTVGGQISATGNITTAGYFLGDGGLLSNIASSYGNANVAAFLPTYTGDLAGNNLALQGAAVVTGNITTGGYLFGNGSQLTGIAASYGNANVAAFLPTYTGNLAGGNLTVTDSITGASITSTGGISAAGDISTYANVRTLGAQGNIVGADYISANYFAGDGSLLTNIAGTGYGNANVAAFLPTYGGTILANLINFTNNSGIIEQGADRLTITGNATNVNTGAYFNDTGEAAIFANSYVAIATNTTANVNPTWTFGADGNLSAPGNIATSGNVETGNIIVADDRVIYASHGYYGPPDSTFAPVRVGLYGPNPNYAIGVESNHSWIQGQNGVKLYDGSGVTLVANAAGITGANILTGGQVTATGNITGAYILGNGSQLTGLPATYGNSNVTTLLAAFGSNTISTSGNVTVGNLTVTGTETDTGNITGGNLLTGGRVSATGNITGNYFIGNGSQLTGITATANAGGSNTQIQYNNAGIFAGNGLMTFSNATGNINLGNLVLNTNNIQTNVAMDMANVTGTIANGNTTPWRITIGNGYQGSFSSVYDYSAAPYNTNYPRLLVGDYYTVGTGVRNFLQTNYIWANVSANISNTSTRVTNTRMVSVLGGGTNNSTLTTNNQFGVTSLATQIYVGANGSSTANALSSVGNISILSSGTVGVFSGIQVNAGSIANSVGGFAVQLVATDSGGTTGYGNITNAYGFYEYMASNLSNTANISGTNLYVGYYHPGTTSVVPTGGTMGSIARGAGNVAQQPQYWAFRNDDNLARTRLGCLDRFHLYQTATANISGNQILSKTNGQAQQWVLSGNTTITGFSNFVTTTLSPASAVGNVFSTDTVTLLLNQGTTGGYTVTLPTTANVKYAGGVNTVATTTANSITTLTVVGYTNSANASLPTEYLITVSSGFV